MTMIETIIHLATTLVPSMGVLVFLLLHRRQHIRADIQELRMRQEHGQMLRMQDVKHRASLLGAAQAYAPAVAIAIEQLLATLDKPSPASASDLEDHELLDELRRRIDEQDWSIPTTGASSDYHATDGGLFEHLWSPGVQSHCSACDPQTQTPPS